MLECISVATSCSISHLHMKVKMEEKNEKEDKEENNTLSPIVEPSSKMRSKSLHLQNIFMCVHVWDSMFMQSSETSYQIQDRLAGRVCYYH